MAIFSKSNNSYTGTQTDKNTTIITEGTSINGEINISCNLYIDGNFEGTINSSKEVNIGKSGNVKGDIIAERLVVQGFVEGSVNVTKVEIKAAGRVSGTIESEEFVIEARGSFDGSSVLKKSKPESKVTQKQSEKQIKK